jgi:hypothetical protein
VPESFHTDVYANEFTIELTDAPLSHSAVQFCLRDAQYATLGEARRGMERGVKLREYVQTHVIPKNPPPNQPLPPQQHGFPRNAPPGLPVPVLSSASQSRIPLDQRLMTAGQAQVTSQFTAAGALNDGFLPASPPQRSREDDASNDGLTPPSPSPHGDKCKRGHPLKAVAINPQRSSQEVIPPVTPRGTTVGETAHKAEAQDHLSPEMRDQVQDR